MVRAAWAAAFAIGLVTAGGCRSRPVRTTPADASTSPPSPSPIRVGIVESTLVIENDRAPVRLTVDRPGKPRQTLTLEREHVGTLFELAVVGDVEGRALIVVDGYSASRDDPRACSGAMDRRLRVFSLDEPSAPETFQFRLETCERAGARSSFAWDAAEHTLRVETHAGSRAFAVDERGHVVAKPGVPARSVALAPSGPHAESDGASAPMQVTLRKGPRLRTALVVERGREPPNAITFLYDPNATYGATDDVKLLGQAPDLVIAADEFASRPLSPSSYCGGGTERYLHVLDVTGADAPRETLRLLADSCFATMESTKVTFDPKTRALAVESALEGEPRVTRYFFGPAARVVAVEGGRSAAP